jgi:hypothetical protein
MRTIPSVTSRRASRSKAANVYPALLIAGALSATTCGSLASSLSPEALAEFDGIVTHCVSSTDKKFAVAMCDKLVASARKQAEAQSLAHLHLGTVDWTAGGGEEPSLPEDIGIKYPLHLAFYIRGTDGNPAGASATAQFFRPLEITGASGNPPLQGRLLIWQDGTLGSGPPGPTANAVAAAVGKKMSSVFDALAERPVPSAE